MKGTAAISGQLYLDGFGEAPPPTDRLLFLIYPDLDAAGLIAGRVMDLRARHGLRGRPVAPDRLHITLHHLGDHAGLPQDMVALARQAAEALSEEPFDVVFDQVASFNGKPGARPFVLRGGAGLAPLVAFQQALGVAMRKTGSRLGRWAEPKFTPHITLLYDGQAVVQRAADPIAWTVREFALVHSLLGQTRHVPLARWSLGR